MSITHGARLKMTSEEKAEIQTLIRDTIATEFANLKKAHDLAASAAGLLDQSAEAIERFWMYGKKPDGMSDRDKAMRDLLMPGCFALVGHLTNGAAHIRREVGRQQMLPHPVASSSRDPG